MIQSGYLQWACILSISLLLVANCPAEQVALPEDILDNLDVPDLDQSLLENIPLEWELPNAEEWQAFWDQMEAILQSQSLDNMAWIRSMAQQACSYLDADPATQPWADWLRQKLDYFDMACVVIQEIPVPAITQPTNAPAPAPSPASPKTPAVKPIPVPTPPPTAKRGREPFAFAVPIKPPASAPASLQVENQRHHLIRNSIRWQKILAKRPVPANAATLIPRLKQVFQREGLPPELVWMAEVESSLNPSARSPVGALGLFQLMPATARRFGLHTGFFDERKNPEKSARAAAQYLKFLYKTMGSWPLALAAYNAGEGRVGKLVKRNTPASFEGIADDLPLETQMYVPKVTALLTLRENTHLDKMPAPVTTARSSNLDFGLMSFHTMFGVCREKYISRLPDLNPCNKRDKVISKNEFSLETAYSQVVRCF